MSDQQDDHYDCPLDKEPRTNNPLGGLIAMVGGLVAFFASGIYFDQFGRPLVFDNPGPYLFYGTIWVSIFGLAWTMVSAWTATRITVVVAGIYLAIFFAGKLSRGEI